MDNVSTTFRDELANAKTGVYDDARFDNFFAAGTVLELLEGTLICRRRLRFVGRVCSYLDVNVVCEMPVR